MRKTMRTVVTCVTIWCTVAGAGVLFAAQTPKSEKEIPIIGGATRDAAAEAEQKEQSAGEQDPGIESAVAKVYKSGASPEEVFNFYLQKIGGKEGASWDGDPAKLAPGAASPVATRSDITMMKISRITS